MSLMLPILRRQEGTKVLIGDNLSSHISLDVLHACEENSIKFIALPPNATHLLQPLDVAYFRPMKVKWREVLEDWKNTAVGGKCLQIPKDQFPQLLKKLMDRLANGPTNLVAGFRKTGIYPMNSKEVLDRLPRQIIEGNNLEDSLTEVFLERLKEKRKEMTEKKRSRRTKVNVPPGKSIRASDVSNTSNDNSINGGIDHPQPSTSAACNTLLQEHKTSTTKGKNKKKGHKIGKKKARENESDSSTTEDIIFAETDDSMNMNISFSSSDGEEGSIVHQINTGFTASTIITGEFVIIKYETKFYPGQVTDVDEDGARVKVMEKAGVTTWRWPQVTDEIDYNFKNIMQKICQPKPVGTLKRQLFEVPEMKHFENFLCD